MSTKIQVGVKMKAHEVAAIDAIAEQEGSNRAVIVRRAILDDLRKRLPNYPEEIKMERFLRNRQQAVPTTGKGLKP